VASCKKGGYMNNIVKTSKDNYSSPLAGFVDTVLKNSFSRFFDDDFGGMNENSGNVPVNIRETGQTYEMEVIAPGLKKEDFHIDVNKNLLTIAF
jgi:HSP20 family protein